jgi:sigma-B regulation protein RsbQ
MVGLIAAKKRPELFKSLVMVGPSPCYIDGDGYRGGFTVDQLEELLEFLDSNHLGWSQMMAPLIMGNPDRPELSEELTESFCRTAPDIARHFARITFMTDCRDLLVDFDIPTLILQCSNDVIAPVEVGEYVHGRLRNSQLVVLTATGLVQTSAPPMKQSWRSTPSLVKQPEWSSLNLPACETTMRACSRTPRSET